MTDICDLFAGCIGVENVVSGERLALRNPGYCEDSFVSGVLLTPISTEQVSQICKLAQAHQIPIVPHGGLTGLVQGTASKPGQVALSLENMNSVREVDPIQGMIVADAGVVLQQVIDATEPHGMHVGVDLPSRGSLTLGGMASTNAGGIQALRYGMARDNILGLEVVLPDGTVLDLTNRLVKNNAGYDLKQLFIGAEGTLGIITKVVMRLHSKPAGIGTALIGCPSADALFDVLLSAKQSFGGGLISFEAMWPDYFNLTTGHLGNRLLETECAIYGIIEIGQWGAGDAQELLTEFLADGFERGTIADGVVAQSDTQRQAIWQIREDSDIVDTAHGPSLSYDVGLLLRDIPDYVARIKSRLSAECPEMESFVFGHLGDGNLHVMVGPAPAPGQHATVDNIIYGALEAFHHTTVSAEHGIGLEKKSHLSQSRSPEAISTMLEIKKALDPSNMANPGKILSGQ
ncbi:FAD-binding oxidoreductase [Roseovarius sp. ZX-A-9]|uniref:FAD-binding oxidoreductase n=1 Tax=Roseovarius sp. ZX-A-9 TaxID=3014783 RepID=UPI00232E6633|nr:FAD-binding oxidoreductase [Roseovarius sp. ZX-A-9]